jgi:polysulfide reductase chain C
MTELSWGILLAAYLFVGGMAGGAYMVAALLDLLGKRKYQVLSKSGTYLSFLLIIVGLVLLVLDLGRFEVAPFAILNAYVHFPTSMMSVGTWIITGLAVVSLLTSILWFFNGNKFVRKILEVIGFILGGSTAAYTGLLLALARGRLFWSQPFLPWLFTVSGTVTGLAMALLFIPLIAWFMPRFFEEFKNLVKNRHEFSEILFKSHRYFDILTIIELVLVLVMLGAGYGGALLSMGRLSALFLVYIIFGLLVPLGISYYSRKIEDSLDYGLLFPASITSFILILIGGFLLRYVILTAGQLI